MDATPDTYWDLFLGYSAIWFCVVIYLLRLQVAQRKLSELLGASEEGSNSQ